MERAKRNRTAATRFHKDIRQVDFATEPAQAVVLRAPHSGTARKILAQPSLDRPERGRGNLNAGIYARHSTRSQDTSDPICFYMHAGGFCPRPNKGPIYPTSSHAGRIGAATWASAAVDLPLLFSSCPRKQHSRRDTEEE